MLLDVSCYIYIFLKNKQIILYICLIIFNNFFFFLGTNERFGLTFGAGTYIAIEQVRGAGGQEHRRDGTPAKLEDVSQL